MHYSGKATSLPSIQTNYIHATDDATLSSPTKSLAIDAAGEVELKSFGGSINAYALDNMTISAPHVRIVKFKSHHKHYFDIFSLLGDSTLKSIHAANSAQKGY